MTDTPAGPAPGTTPAVARAAVREALILFVGDPDWLDEMTDAAVAAAVPHLVAAELERIRVALLARCKGGPGEANFAVWWSDILAVLDSTGTQPQHAAYRNPDGSYHTSPPQDGQWQDKYPYGNAGD
jgi:hypothetical protein